MPSPNIFLQEITVSATIGIKIANGEFYSILEENSSVKKRLVLTTVHDRQQSVQIDLYKSYSRTMADAVYIGSLVAEDLVPRPKGIPSIEMVINSTADGNITADIWDMDTTTLQEHKYLNISLKSLEEDNRDYEIPDFALEDTERPPQGLYGKADSVLKNSKKRNPLRVIIIAALVFILLCAGLLVYLRQGGNPAADRLAQSIQQSAPVQQPAPAPQPAPQPASQPAVPVAPQPQPAPPADQSSAQPIPEPQPAPPPAEQSSIQNTEQGSGQPTAVPQEPPAAQPAPPPVQPTPPPAQPAPPPVITAPARAPAPVVAQRTRPVPPVRSYKVPATIPRDGVRYTIRWGDTLWDIAEAFYRNPWLYPRIARFNNIRNPDLIISGTTIRVPPKN